MKRALIRQKLWQDLVPVCKPSPKGGRPRCDDRAAFNGILFVLMTGIPWEDLPQELGFGSGMTCWRRQSRLRLFEHAGARDKWMGCFTQAPARPPEAPPVGHVLMA